MASMTTVDGDEASPPREPAFRVRSNFGGARKWRSRTSRPCDVCRRRKTACIIESVPPCMFCKTRGIPCESSSRLPPQRKRQKDQLPISPTPEGAERGGCNSSSGHSSEEEDDDRMLEISHGSLDDEDQSMAESVAESGLGDSSSPFLVRPGAGQIPSPTDSIENGGRTFDIHHSPSDGSYYDCNASQSPGKSRPMQTFHYGDLRTAHSMGLSGEQDTNLLASLRSIIVNEKNVVDADMIQVYPGDPACGEPPIHFNFVTDSLPQRDTSAKERASDAMEDLVGGHGPLLVSLYFKHVHPMNLVVSKSQFLRAYHAKKTSVPGSLRGVIYGLGAMSWKRDPQCAELPCPNIYLLFRQAHVSLHTEVHAPNQWTHQASLLLLHERPGDNFTTETPRTWILAAQASASAQMLGLHRDPKLWSIGPWEKRVRRKLFWSTYMADVWTSVCHGNPPHVSRDSFTTAPIQIEDIAMDENVDADLRHFVGESCGVTASARFVESVKLSRILHELLDAFYSDQAYKSTIGDTAAREAKLSDIEKQLDSWILLRASCVGKVTSDDPHDFGTNGPLHLAYFAVKALLFRALMWPTTMTAKLDPKSSLRRFFDKVLREFSPFYDFIESIDARSLNRFWGAHARSQLVLCGNFLVFLFLMAPTPDHVQATFRLLESVHAALNRCRDLADNEDAVAMLRPVLLRMDTLFTQAARIMDTRTEPSV